MLVHLRSFLILALDDKKSRSVSIVVKYLTVVIMVDRWTTWSGHSVRNSSRWWDKVDVRKNN